MASEDDLEQKHTPEVLLLYSYDCAAHENVVSAFGGYLIETFNCNVHLDLFEEQIIQDKGLEFLDDWLIDKLQEADFIIVLCSIGARLRCCKKRIKFKIDSSRSLPDYFAVAVDYVAEKMRVERSKGLTLEKFVVAYMDYSTASDIPHQLEVATKFCLMKNIDALYCHLHGISSSPEPSKDVGYSGLGITHKTYDESELGAELRVAIESAKEYFKSNPTWVEDRIELLPAPSNKSKARHVRQSSLEPLLPVIDKGERKHAGDTAVPAQKSSSYDTAAEVYSQTLPRTAKQNQLTSSMNMLPNNRQNSLPSSLSSHLTPTPPIHGTSSRSYENLHMAGSKFSADLETWPCIRCGQELRVLSMRYMQCRCRPSSPQRTNDNVLDIEDEKVEFNSAQNGKSKSMPSMYGRTVFHSSQTVLQAEVHKEWDDHDEGKMTPTDSQETSSIADLSFDDLEKDLQSIILPPPVSSPNSCPSQQKSHPCTGNSRRYPGLVIQGINSVHFTAHIPPHRKEGLSRTQSLGSGGAGRPVLMPVQISKFGSSSTLDSQGEPVINNEDILL